VLLTCLAAASMWFYVDRILVSYQITEAAEHNRPRGNLSDLYPRWLGARELLLHGRNPYSPEIATEIQRGYYGRPIDPSRPDDPRDQQGFAYPVYVVFLLAPLIGFTFHAVQLFFHWSLIGLTGGSVLLWLRALRWKLSLPVIASCVLLTLGSVPAVQGIKLQQLSLLVGALLAAAAASVAGGYLVAGGAFLALATIKPQLAWPVVAWLVIWAVSDWKVRRRLLYSFAATMALLLIASEVVLPGWLGMFLDAVRQYHQYTKNESVLDQLVNWALGPHGGAVLAALAAAATAPALWKLRRESGGSEGFGMAIALVLALTVLIVPMYAPYNQVLLLPSIFWLARQWSGSIGRSHAMRATYAVAGLALGWQWLASLCVVGVWVLSPATAMQWWKAPFYATFALPVVVFALVALATRRSTAVLRAPDRSE
jgi:hypothetical protein